MKPGEALGGIKKFFQRMMNEDTKVTLDLIFGLRGWGLILYGVLPANLTLLGILEVKLANVAELIPFALPAALLPMLTTFLLIRNRHKDWYLTIRLLKTRSLIVTLVILLLATFISGVSGIIHGKYHFGIHYFGTKAHWLTIAESFLMAVGSLVLTSTLFLTLLTKDSDFPGLPSPDFVKLVKTIRGTLRQLQASQIWTDVSKLEPETTTNAKTLAGNLTELSGYSGLAVAKLSFEPVGAGVESFSRALKRIVDGGNLTSKQISWARDFGASVDVSKKEQQDEKGRQENLAPEAIPDDASRIRFLKELPLGK